MALRVISGDYDITDDIEGLSWSSVNPGGDETCTFTLKRSWFASSPEIDRGNLLRVLDGIDELWRGRVEEADRSGEDTEQIGVTAYGLGARLKDTTMQEIYVTRDLSRWGAPSAQRTLGIVGALGDLSAGSVATRGKDAAGLGPGVTFGFSRVAEGKFETGQVTFYGGGVDLGELRYDFNPFGAGADANWNDLAYLSLDDLLSVGTYDSGTDHNQTAASNQSLVASTSGRKYAHLESTYVAAGTTDLNVTHGWLNIRVFGRHGLTKQGSQPDEGFLVTQIIANAVARATDITVRRIDTTTFVLQEAAFFDPVQIEAVIADVHKYEAYHRTWGTWGTDSPLDSSENGYFDYREIETSPSWIVYREECDNCNLHSEMSTLYNKVKVRYTDASGVSRTVERTASVPDLNGVEREQTIDGGTLTKAGAETLGDAFLALSGGFAPARGRAVISRPIHHVSRGTLPPHYMRADGSAFRIPDVLPSPSLFALDSTPDRRTTFPIKRVSVDAGNKAVPVATVEVDQTNDAITALQARLSEDAQRVGG